MAALPVMAWSASLTKLLIRDCKGVFLRFIRVVYTFLFLTAFWHTVSLFSTGKHYPLGPQCIAYKDSSDLSGKKFLRNSGPTSALSLKTDWACIAKLQAYRHNTPTVVFLGDSRMRQLRDALMYRLEGIDQDWLANRSIIHNETTYRKHSDRTMILTPDNNTYFQMDFLWSGDIEMVVKNFIYYALGQRRLKNATKRTYREANLFVITGSPWQFTKCTRQERLVSGCTTEYQRLFLKFLVLLRRSGLTSPVLWVPQTPLDNIREKYLGVTNDQMRGYNAVVETAILSYNWTSFIYWKSYEKAFSLQDSLDGIHLGPRAKEKDVSFLLDYICHLATGIFCQQESI